LDLLALLVDEQLRVADDVDEQDVPNLELQIRNGLGGHTELLFFQRERGDDFFEAWIAAQRIPGRV